MRLYSRMGLNCNIVERTRTLPTLYADGIWKIPELFLDATLDNHQSKLTITRECLTNRICHNTIPTRRKIYMDMIVFLKVMIEDEKAAIEKYQLAIDNADSKQLITILEQLRDEEEIHIDLLENEISRLQAGS